VSSSTEAEGRSGLQALRAVTGFARARYELRGAKLGLRVRSYGTMVVRGARGIEVGTRCVFLGGTVPTELICGEGARLTIGPRCIFNYGVSLVARERVRVGAGCRIGSFVHVRDDDGRRREPVIIEDDAWIAHGAILEPGAHIGRGSVVSAGSVVFGAIPPGSLATGNPAASAPLGSSRPAASRVCAGAPDTRAASGVSRGDVRAAIVEWLDDTRHFGEAEALITSDEVSLHEGGLLDSLGLVGLVLMLEKRFGVTIDRGILASPEHQSVRALVDLVVGQPVPSFGGAPPPPEHA
jgi:maltose O-acetyltransferase